MQIYPAIDIRDGNCVRLTQGNFDQETVYGADPADMARRWVSEGAKRLHIVDLDGAREGSTPNFEWVQKIVETTKIPCQLGGGIRNEAVIAKYLDIGVARLVIGTRAVTDPRWLAEMTEEFPNRLLVGIDAREGRVATNGWESTSDQSAFDFARQICELPVAGIIYTDISKDGMLSGPNFDSMKQMHELIHVPLIASGGVTTIEDVRTLAEMGIEACIIGRSLYEGKIELASALQAVSEVVQGTSP